MPAETVPAELPHGVSADDLNSLMVITNKSREQCLKALEFAHGNVNNACTLILEGNLDHLTRGQETAPASEQSQQSNNQFGFSPGIYRQLTAMVSHAHNQKLFLQMTQDNATY